MKLEVIPPPEPQFRPIVITLETEAEAALLKGLLGATSPHVINRALTRDGAFDDSTAKAVGAASLAMYKELERCIGSARFLFEVSEGRER